MPGSEANRSFRRVALGLALCVGLPAPAAVALTQFVVSGQLSDIVVGGGLNTTFGLANGDPFEITAIYEETLLTNSDFEELSLNPNTNPGHSFNLNIKSGTLTFSQDDDEFSAAGFPQIEFQDGIFLQFDFLSQLFPQGSPRFQASVTSDLALFDRDVPQGDVGAVGEFAVSQSFPLDDMTQ